jgi:hypothetical protein
MTRQNRTYGPNNSRYDPSGGRILSNTKFGLKGDHFTSAEQARAALAAAQKNEIASVFGTRGAGGLSGKTWYKNRAGDVLNGNPAGLYIGAGMPYSLPGYYLGDVDIMEQEQRPENPGPREFRTSTWGHNIPISLGNTRVACFVLEAKKIVPTIEGEYDYEITYKVPIYQFNPD